MVVAHIVLGVQPGIFQDRGFLQKGQSDNHFIYNT